MPETWILVAGLAVGTFVIRLGGLLLGARLPATGGWARAFQAMPGCLIAALLTVILMRGTLAEWLAAGAALAIAVPTRSLALTMLAGIVTVTVARALL